MKRIASRLGFSFALLAVAGAVGFVTLDSFNQFDEVKSSFAGSCQPVTGIPGPEDLQIDPATRTAFISSYDRREDTGRGGIYAISIDDPLSAEWRDRTGGAPEEFEPLGLYFYRDAEYRRLFVANGATKSVELYDVLDNGDLVHRETFKERRLTSPNDVVAVGPRDFYVTNDFGAGRDSLLARVEFLTRARSGKLLQFNGMAWKLAAEDLRFANGVAASNDGRRIYVAETAGGALRIYDRDAANGHLTLSETVPMGVAIDNINVDRTGTLWIGAHPKPLILPLYAKNPSIKAPSLVIRYDDMPGVLGKPAEVYANDGAEISASTAAARLGSTLLIGALFEKKFLICQLPG